MIFVFVLFPFWWVKSKCRQLIADFYLFLCQLIVVSHFSQESQKALGCQNGLGCQKASELLMPVGWFVLFCFSYLLFHLVNWCFLCYFPFCHVWFSSSRSRWLTVVFVYFLHSLLAAWDASWGILCTGKLIIVFHFCCTTWLTDDFCSWYFIFCWVQSMPSGSRQLIVFCFLHETLLMQVCVFCFSTGRLV